VAAHDLIPTYKWLNADANALSYFGCGQATLSANVTNKLAKAGFASHLKIPLQADIVTVAQRPQP
jgi:hypothetical protein